MCCAEQPIAMAKTRVNEFIDKVANAFRVMRVNDILVDGIDQAEAMIGLAKQDNTSTGSETLIGELNLYAAIELWIKQVDLYFTHRVIHTMLNRMCF